jgi:molecular chaperone DnaK
MSAEGRAPAIVGIDLGTTYSAVAHLGVDGKAVTIPNAEGDLTTPSVVYFDRSGPVVGKEAVKAGSEEPDRIAQFAKRDMGRPAYHRGICGTRVPPEVIQALILRKLKADAELRLGSVQKAVITVPAYFNEPRRKATQDAGRLAGLEVVDIVNEPTAAAIAYGVHEGFVDASGHTQRRETVLVYDLGGGTFDATIMTLDGSDYKAVATAGDVYLGGIDWDRRIVDHVGATFRREHGVDPREDPRALQELMRQAEDAKRALTARLDVTIHFSFGGKRIRVPLTREQFEALTADLLERTVFTIKKLLKEASLTWSSVPRILLVGGSTRMPMVAARLGREFETEIDRSLAPDEAVAHGAALYAEFLLARGGSGRPRMSVHNVNSHDLGVLAIEDATNRPRRKIQIPRNTPLPAVGRSRFHTRRDDQRHVAVPVIEGGDASGRDATAIGRCVITDLPPGLPAGTPIDVAFTYAEDGRLTVRAELPTVNRRATLVIQRASGLSTEFLHQWEERIKNGSLPGIDAGPGDQAIGSPQPESEGPTPENFRVLCPNGHDLSCSLSLQGKAGKCPKCGVEFVIPYIGGAEGEADSGDPDLDDFLQGFG